MILTCIFPPKTFQRLFMFQSAMTSFLERMNKIKISIEEACGVFQLRVVTDVFVQNGHCWPLDQPSAGTKNEVGRGGLNIPSRNLENSYFVSNLV